MNHHWEPTVWDQVCMSLDYWRRKYRNQLIRALGGYDQVAVTNMLHATGKLISMRRLSKVAPDNPLYPQMVSVAERRVATYVAALDPQAAKQYEQIPVPVERAA